MASLTSNTENLTGVFTATEIQTMLSLTSSEEENCRRDSLVALGNLAIVASNQVYKQNSQFLLPHYYNYIYTYSY